MLKKIVCLGIAFAILFSLAACQDNELAEYKITAKIELETYAEGKGQSNYTAYNWELLLGFVSNGKNEIDDAANIPAVDIAFDTAKAAIDEVLEAKEILQQGIYITDDKIGRIKLYGDSAFSFSIAHISHLPMGSYAIINGKLIFHLSNFELIFDIESDRIVFIGAYIEGLEMDWITQPGTIFNFSEEIEMLEEVTEDMVDCSSYRYDISKSSIGPPIVLKNIDKNAVFECTVDKGLFVLLGNPTQYVKNVQIKPGDGFYWQPENDCETGQAFVDIVLKIDDSIIGYAVVEIYPNDPLGLNFLARNLKSAIFPKVDGEYQNVSEEYVKVAIKKVKNVDLKQGIYITDDGIGRIELYGNYLFIISIVYISHVPTGSYAIVNDKLIFYLSDFELLFDIENGRIIFIGAYLEGLEHDFFIQPGTIFKLSEKVEIVEVETEDMIEFYDVPTSTGISLIAIVLKGANDNSVFDCIVDEGNFFLQAQGGDKSVSVIAGTTISWMPVGIGIDGKSIPLQIEKAFIDVILKLNDNIIGYAVIEIHKADNSNSHVAKLLKSALFLKVDGEYQNITENQVKSIIKKIKGNTSL